MNYLALEYEWGRGWPPSMARETLHSLARLEGKKENVYDERQHVALVNKPLTPEDVAGAFGYIFQANVCFNFKLLKVRDGHFNYF